MTPFALALASITVPTDAGTYHVLQLSGDHVFYAGRDTFGMATLLIRTPDGGRTVPLKLAGIEARFSVPCRIAGSGEVTRTEPLTAVMCLSHDPEVEGYFARIVDLLVGALGPSPTSVAVAAAINELVELFQKLRRPARTPIVGLVGELIVIAAARSASTATAAWRMDPDERYDFSIENLRVESKAATSRKRSHFLSAEQADPPSGTVGLLASVFVEQAGGGTSLERLLDIVEAVLPGHAHITRLRSIVADTLGADLPGAMGWTFDLAGALSSLAWFDLRVVPAVRGPAPVGVSAIRFLSDLSACPTVGAADVVDVFPGARPLLPF